MSLEKKQNKPVAASAKPKVNKEIKEIKSTSSVNTKIEGNEEKEMSQIKGKSKATESGDRGSLYAKKKNIKRKQFARREEKKEFDQKIIDLARVTRVMAGGKRMSFRACVVIGDYKGKVAVGLAKGPDVTIAISKAVMQAKKDIINVPITKENSISHEIYQKNGAAKILFRPAKVGHGVIAGGVVRVILEFAGIKNITSKILGTSNKVNNAKCTIEALRSLGQ